MVKVEITKSLKQSAWAAIIESLATIALGILLIVLPDVVVKIIAYVVGAFFIIKGACQIINYFLAKGQNDFLNNNLLVGIVSILLGVVAVLMGEDVANIFRVIIGIWLIYESLVRMNTAIKLHAVNIAAWKYILILALIMLVFGIFITFYTGAVIVLIGWTMVLVGVIGIIGDIMFIRRVNLVVEKLTK